MQYPSLRVIGCCNENTRKEGVDKILLITQLNGCLVELVYVLHIKTFKVPQAVGNT